MLTHKDAPSRHEVPGGRDPGRAGALLDWLAERGAGFDGLLLTSESGTERGVRARRDIDAGERVLSIPRSCLLTIARGDTASAHSHLAARLLHERGDARSVWRAYLDGLPTSFPSVPLFYGEEDIALLRGSYLLDMIALRRASLRDDFARLRSAVELADASLDAFVWARLVVCSRVFGVVVGG
jgi:histone-lysine N-methyltransferase SETD3